MRKYFFFLLSAALLLQAAERNTLETYGESVYEILPDTVIISLGVQREGLTAEDAQNALRKALSSVLEALQPLDLPNENIQTDSYSLYPVYKQRKDTTGGNYETEEIDRYRTYIRLSIELHQISQAGKIADTAIKAGVNRVENISFTLKDRETARAEALKLAVDNAQAKARLLADKFKVKLLQPIFIGESTDSLQPAYRNTAALMAKSSADLALPEGKVQVRSRVEVKYETAPAVSENVTASIE